MRAFYCHLKTISYVDGFFIFVMGRFDRFDQGVDVEFSVLL